MSEKDPNDFAPYEDYLHTHLWPTVNPRSGELDSVVVERSAMAPQYAAAALAKLVRWARVAPMGDIVLCPDEDSREEAVRGTRLGKALAARAVNLDVDIFFAMYGEFGVTPKVDPDFLAALLIEELRENGLDWSPRDRILLALKLARAIVEEFNVHEKVLS